MGQDKLGAYEEAVDALVNVIEAFPEKEARFDTADLGDGELLERVVDEYAVRAGDVFDALTETGIDEATYERLLALAAGDLRLAASLISVDETPLDADPEEVSNLRADLADLRDDMNDVKAAVREEPEDTDGDDGGSHDPPPELPNPSAPRGVIPPLYESSFAQRLDVAQLALVPELGEQVGAVERPVAGAAEDSAASVKGDIDEILEKGAAQIGDLLIAGLTLSKFAVEQFDNLVAGHLGEWYDRLQDKLTGITQRAKRAAVKLLYEGVEKLLCLLRRALPPDTTVTAPEVRTALDQLATWLGKFALQGTIQGRLESLLDARALKAHVDRTFGHLPTDERVGRAFEASARAARYRKRKFPIGVARLLIRAVRVFRLQHSAPPGSEVAMACAVLALCGISGWMAQDALDHPSLRFVPDLQRGVRSAVDGR